MRPTRAGVAVLVAVPVTALLAWLFGQPELAAAAVAALVVVAGGAVLVVLRRPRVRVLRSARPDRVHLGEPCRIVLRVHNGGRGRSPVLSLHDEVGPFGRASLHVPPLPRGGTRDAVYGFPTDRRGVHRVGPLTTVVEDGFGLVRATSVSAELDTVIVLPRVLDLVPLPAAPGDDPEPGSRLSVASSTVDEEFTTLRPYLPGDDIRRIHWRTTARLGEPVVRQFEQPWQHRLTVLADLRAAVHDEAGFERTLSAVASLVALAARRGELLRLVTTDGADTGFVPAPERLDPLLDSLAAASPTSTGSLTEPLSRLGGGGSGGRLVVCAGNLDAVEHAAVCRSARRYGVALLVVSGRLSASADPGAPVVVPWDGRDEPSRAWATGVAAASVRSRAVEVRR